MIFWTLWGIDALVAAILIVFFVIGLADGSVSSFNIRLWLALLGAGAALLCGTPLLHGAGRASLAQTLLGIVAVPAVATGLLLLAALVLKPRWN